MIRCSTRLGIWSRGLVIVAAGVTVAWLLTARARSANDKRHLYLDLATTVSVYRAVEDGNQERAKSLLRMCLLAQLASHAHLSSSVLATSFFGADPLRTTNFQTFLSAAREILRDAEFVVLKGRNIQIGEDLTIKGAEPKKGAELLRDLHADLAPRTQTNSVRPEEKIKF